VVSRCLAKDPEERWQSARDVVAQLEWIAEGGSRVGPPAIVADRPRVRERLAWIAFALASVAVVGLGIAWARRAPVPPPTVTFSMPMPEGLSQAGVPAVSPDGRTIAFDAVDRGGGRQIWVRPLDQIEARPLAGTEGALRPIWSPDSRSIAFMAEGKLRKVDVSGGLPQTICDAPSGADGSWGPQGVILFDGHGTDPIRRVPATGGVAKPEVDVEPTKGVYGSAWPEFEVYVQEFPESRSKWQVSTNGGTEPFWGGDGREIFYLDPGGSVMSVPAKVGATFEAGASRALIHVNVADIVERAHVRPTQDGQRFLVLVPARQDTVPPTITVLNWTSALR
jgi:hypothetical protein